MVAVDMMEVNENHIDVEEVDGSENGDEEICQKNCLLNQVVIYESGKPLLKVESGITLEIMKLLYEAEYKRPGQNVIGVRPRISKDIPCIVTLKESKLENGSYDLVLRDQHDMSPVSPPTSPPASPSGRCVTTRCIDCSRESWKSKRYISVGMNTEISINPLLEMDSLRNMPLQNTHSTVTQSTHDKTQPRPRGRPPVIQRPVPMPPHGVLYSSFHKKDYMIAVPTMPVGNGTVHAPDFEYYDRQYHHSSRRSPIIHVNPRTQISYPPIGKNDVKNGYDIHLPYHNRHSPIFGRHSPTCRRSSPKHMMRHELSPPHYIRRQSPVPSHGSYAKAEPAEMYYPRYLEGERRSNRESTRDFTGYKTKSPVLPTTSELPALPVEQASTGEVEPPVYVLPNDFDMKRDPLEPHIVDYHPPKTHTLVSPRVNRETDSEQSKLSLQSSPTSGSVKSGDEHQEKPVIAKTLSCKICKKSFPTKSTLYKHLRGHSSDEKPFKCNECGQGFTLSSNLRQHRIIHRGYKPFQCEYCGKKFMRSNVYKQHRRIHTGEQMHKCDICPSEFLQQYALIKHMKKAHNMDTSGN